MRSATAYNLSGQGTDTLVLDIYDIVGGWGYEGPNANSVRRLLKQNADAKTIKLRINSEGGDVFDGFAIYNLLNEHTARVECDIDALAASIASVIAMACDEIRIASNGWMMIHKPWAGIRGEDNDLRRWADVLEKIGEQAAELYAARSGQSKAKCLEMMAAETWMTAAEAKALGFVDKITPAKKAKAATSARAQAFACMSIDDYSNVPAAVREAVEAARAEHNRQQLLTTIPEPELADDEHTDAPNLGLESNDMNKTKLAIILSLDASASDDAFEGAVAAAINDGKAHKALLAKLEAAVGKGGDEMVGVVLAWKQSHDKLPALQEIVATLQASTDAADLDAAIAEAKKDHKLSPALEAEFRRQVAAKETSLTSLKATLKALHPIPALANAAGAAAGGGGDKITVTDGTYKHNGKTFAEMTGPERKALKDENPELYAAMHKASQDS